MSNDTTQAVTAKAMDVVNGEGRQALVNVVCGAA